MEGIFTSNKSGIIVAGNTEYDLVISGESFVLSRFYLGRGLDAEWSGKYYKNIFEFNDILTEELFIYEKYSNSDGSGIFLKGKFGCLGRQIKEVPLYKIN